MTHRQHQHKRTIELLLINLTLTLGMELLWRESLFWLGMATEEMRFLVPQDSGLTLNRQSMINLAMTGLATIIGTWVFFTKTLLARFIGFVSTGLLLSIFAQTIVNLSFANPTLVENDRILFDVFYGATVKFFAFECSRKLLIARDSAYRKLFGVRLAQDATTSLVKVSLLNTLAFT